MGIGEVSATPGQRIHVGRDRFWVASEETRPVVEIIYTDHQDVWVARLLSPFARCGKHQECDDANFITSFH